MKNLFLSYYYLLPSCSPGKVKLNETFFCNNRDSSKKIRMPAPEGIYRLIGLITT